MLVRQLFESDHFWVGKGFYFELYPRESDEHSTSFELKRIMDDSEEITYGVLRIRKVYGFEKHEYSFQFSGLRWPFVTDAGSVFERLERFRAPSEKIAREEGIKWAKGIVAHHAAQLSESLFSDVRKARLAKAQDANPVWLIRLNKNGEESRMNDARTSFKDEKAAKDYHDRMVKLNPNSEIAHMMYSTDGEQTLRVKLVGGKTVKAPGGVRVKVAESRGYSTEVQVLQDALKKGPIFHAGYNDGELVFHEIYSIESNGTRYSPEAPEGLRGRPFAVGLFKAPGYNSVNGKSGIGTGWGNGSFTIPDDDEEKNVFVKKVKIWSDQPEFLVVYNFKRIEKDIDEHDARMRRQK